VKISWSEAEICPQNEIRNGPLAAEFTSGSNFHNCHPSGNFLRITVQNLKKSLNARLSYYDSFSSPHAFKPTLPTAQRHNAIMQTIHTSARFGEISAAAGATFWYSPNYYCTSAKRYHDARKEFREAFNERQQNELDEADLRRWLSHFVTVHERSDRQPFQLLQVTLYANKRNHLTYSDLEFLRLQSWSRDVSRPNLQNLSLCLGPRSLGLGHDTSSLVFNNCFHFKSEHTESRRLFTLSESKHFITQNRP